VGKLSGLSLLVSYKPLGLSISRSGATGHKSASQGSGSVQDNDRTLLAAQQLITRRSPQQSAATQIISMAATDKSLLAEPTGSSHLKKLVIDTPSTSDGPKVVDVDAPPPPPEDDLEVEEVEPS
jgi:hypothetical protein